MSRDPLEVLARLRRFEVNVAQRDLATRLRAAAEAESASDAARTVIAREAAFAAEPAAAALFSKWLPHAQAIAQAAQAAHQLAEAQSGQARAALAAAHAAARASGLLQARRVEITRLAMLRAEQAALDEQAARAGDVTGPGRSAQ